MTVEGQKTLTTNTIAHNSAQAENIGQQARLESGKNFEAAFGKLLQKIQKHIAVASMKGLWRVRIDLPRSLWTLDRENQRRIIQKLKDNELAPHLKILQDKIVLSIYWSEADMKLTAQELETLDEAEPTLPNLIKQNRKPALEQQSNLSTVEQPNVLTLKEAQTEQNFGLIPLEPTEVVYQTVGSSSEEHEATLLPRSSQKEARLAEKEQKKLARQREVQEIKRARREEREKKFRQKQLINKKERLEEREKKKEEKLKLKALKEQRLLNRAKKEKNDEKKKLKLKKKKEKKEESSSSSERTWYDTDLSLSSDSESD